ncbi:MAG: recombinase zinc beta ribbon domain-containing protein, partial [Gemmatimonadota bacterium]
YRTRRGSKFSARVVLDMLGHPAYIGSVRFRGQIVAEGVHEPILDRETYEDVRRLREARRASPSQGRGREPKGSHLLTRGMLRCGSCGSAMAPKTSAEGYERYRCGRRRTYGDCAMPDLARARVDEAVFGHFERAALDVEGTVAELTVEARRRIAQTQSLAEQAERQAVEIEQGRERADRAFLSGAIEEKDYRRLLAQVEEEGPAAQAEADRLRAQVAALEEELVELDAETVVAERLAEIRRSVAERVTSGESVEAIRAALVSLFEHFTLTLDEETGDVALEPIVRPDVLELRPVLDPETLTEAERLADEGLDFAEIGERLRLPEGWQDEPAVRVALRKATLPLGEKVGAKPPSP